MTYKKKKVRKWRKRGTSCDYLLGHLEKAMMEALDHLERRTGEEPAVINHALGVYIDTGEWPENPLTREIIQGVVSFLEETDAVSGRTRLEDVTPVSPVAGLYRPELLQGVVDRVKAISD